MRTTPLALTAIIVLLGVARPELAAQARGDAVAPRPLPYPLEVPHAFQTALAHGTRSPNGAPGPNYWQNWTDYTVHARLDTLAKRVDGTAHIVYHNRSPQPLPVLVLQLILNVQVEGTVRNRQVEVTPGMEIKRLVVQGEQLAAVTPETGAGVQSGYLVDETRLEVKPSQPIPSGGAAVLDIDYGLMIPQRGAAGRMGWSRDDLFYLAYWYPQMAVFDDVWGWQADAFLGNAEFYMGYGDYDVTLEVPQGWVVMGTGQLTNADSVLEPAIVARLHAAEASDTVVHVVTAADFGAGKATQQSASGWLSWHFTADSVRDVAYSVTRASMWDAARTPVGDRNGDGQPEYARVDAIYRATAPRWAQSWRYVQHSIDFLSRWTAFPYPWSHMTAVEGDGIIGGGMEYPMMTLISAYTDASDTALYGVTAHELGHMWFPMIVGSDERRRSWMDEGTTTFNAGAAENEFFPGRRWEAGNYEAYAEITRTDQEGPIMRWSDFHYTGYEYTMASYGKPAMLLWTLRGLLGEETFAKTYHTYLRRWAFKHPKPWDFFNTFNDGSGRNLDWFWRVFYYDTWTLDQAVTSVKTARNGTTITVADLGLAPMPARLTITLADGRTMKGEIPVARWLAGAHTADYVVKTSSPVVKVEIDAEQVFPDVDRTNNVWEKQ
jgi:hypothetical protein